MSTFILSRSSSFVFDLDHFAFAHTALQLTKYGLQVFVALFKQALSDRLRICLALLLRLLNFEAAMAATAWLFFAIKQKDFR